MFSLFNLSAMQNCDYLFAEMPMVFFFIERPPPPECKWVLWVSPTGE